VNIFERIDEKIKTVYRDLYREPSLILLSPEDFTEFIAECVAILRYTGDRPTNHDLDKRSAKHRKVIVYRGIQVVEIVDRVDSPMVVIGV